MKVGYAVLYENEELVISKNHTVLKKKIIKNYGEFDDTNVPWEKESRQIKKIQILDHVKSNCMKAWFYNCINLTTLIDFQNLDVSDCVDFSFMFAFCQSLQNLNGLEIWKIFNGINFSKMFSYCISLQNINALKNWDVSDGTDFSFMFSYCESLQNIDALTNWNVSNEEYFSWIFQNCQSLKKNSLPKSMKYLNRDMFFNCNEDLKIHWKNHIYIYVDLLAYEEIS